MAVLGDRDCSLQRRRQKLIEIAPAAISDAIRARLSAAAVALTASVRYAGLATVEFLVQADTIVFLEVNPRLQVEHTVTEQVTGLDLVELALRVADGARLDALPLDGGPPRGGAVQARINTETLIEQVFRDDWARVLASLIGYFGDFDLAEEAAAEAFAIAAERWPSDGRPVNPGAWLVTTARHRAIDRLRRDRVLAAKLALLAAEPTGEDPIVRRREHCSSN
jgi:hypothetical protein